MHITDDAILALRDALEDIIHQIGHHSLSNFEVLNSNRERQGLRALKRLNSWSIEKAAQKIINEDTISSIGAQPAMVRSPDGERMLKSKSVIKLDTDTWTTGGIDDKR